MIKAIVTDVDGVLMGSRVGYNFPDPTPEVVAALKKVHKSGVPVVLCTAKVGFAIENIITGADLRNPHIADGGAFIFDLLDKKVIKENILDASLVKQIVQLCVSHGIHCTTHTIKDVFLDKTHNKIITEKRQVILKRELTVVDSLHVHSDSQKIIKITLTVQNKAEKALVEKILAPFEGKINFIWSHNPMSDPWEYGIISGIGISKASATREVAKILNVDLKDVLGVGDGISDWVFMQECGYVGVTGDKSEELLKLASSHGKGKYVLAPSVDENGFLEILKQFKLI